MMRKYTNMQQNSEFSSAQTTQIVHARGFVIKHKLLIRWIHYPEIDEGFVLRKHYMWLITSSLNEVQYLNHTEVIRDSQISP
jgi:hypothetical protein